MSASAPKGAPDAQTIAGARGYMLGALTAQEKGPGARSLQRGAEGPAILNTSEEMKSISTAQPFGQFCGTIYNLPLER